MIAKLADRALRLDGSSTLIPESLFSEFVQHMDNCLNQILSDAFYITSDDFDLSSLCLRPIDYTLINKIPNKVMQCIFVIL